VLKDNRPEDKDLQTRLLEVSLQRHPQIAEQLLQSNQFTAFDQEKIARLCERAGLPARALTLSSKEDDIKRVLLHTQDIANVVPPKLIIKSVECLDVQSSLEVLTHLLNQSKNNLFVAHKIAE